MYIIRTTPLNVTIKTLDELKAAILYAADGDTLLLENCQDDGGFYNLSSTGFDYPDYFVNLTVTKASGHTPTLFGTFKSKTTKMKLKTYTLDGLTFDGTGKTNAEGCATFYMLANDSITTELNIKNCSFINLGISGGGRIIDANGCDKHLVKKFVFENNFVDNFGNTTAAGSTGQTFMQWRNSGSYEFDNIIIRNNTIHNWHGNQFLNINRQKTSSLDSTINITFENNTLYRFAGNATSDRNFIEWTNNMGGVAATININNNLFYKNWANGSKNFRLHLFTPVNTAQTAKVVLNVRNNFFYEDSVMFNSLYTCNLPITNGTLTYTNYSALTKTSMGLTTRILVDEAKADTTMDLEMYQQSPLFTAGLGGTCVGDPRWYTNTGTPAPWTSIKPASTSKLFVWSNNGRVYVQGATKDVTIHNLLGQKVGTFTANNAANGIEIGTKGMYILTTNNESIRIMIR